MGLYNLHVANQGLGDAAATTADIYLGTTLTGTLIATVSLPALAAGEQAVVSSGWDGSGYAGQEVVLSALVDPADAVVEFRQANNQVQGRTLLPQPTADLAVTLGDAPDPAAVGQAIVYQATVTGHGPATATGVELRQVLPVGVLVRPLTASQGNCQTDGRLVTCQLGSVAQGGSATVTAMVTATAAGALFSQARVTEAEYDPDRTNDIASEGTTILAGGVAPASVVVVGPASGSLGATYTFAATVGPLSVDQPLTFVWQATDQAVITHTAGLSDMVSYRWTSAGIKVVSVTAHNQVGSALGSQQIVIAGMEVFLPLLLRQ